MPPWQFIEAVQGVTAPNTPTSVYRVSFAAPTKMRAGDQLVMLLGSQVTGVVYLPFAQSWDFDNAVPSGSKDLRVLRRVVTESEPSSYYVDSNGSQETIGALLVYRGLDAAALVGGSATDLVAQTAFPCPSRTLTRYSDLYLGLVLLLNPAGTVTPPAGAGERVEFSSSAFGIDTLRLAVFDFAAEAVGATGAKNATITAAASGAAISLAVQGMPAPGQGLHWKPVVPGAIGLPTEGI